MSEVREGYKMTELGEIPVDWRIVELNEIADVKGGKRLPKGEQLVEYDTGLPYIRVSDMDEKGLKVDNIMFVPEHVAPKISNYRIYKDEIYISVAGTLGLIGIVPEALDGANLTENADRICNIKTDNIYLNYYLKSQFIQNVISSVRTTSAQPKLALNQIKSFQILLPNRDEQQKIASILSTVDEQIDETEQLIVKTKELKKGLMQQLLTKGIRHTKFTQTELGNLPLSWKISDFKDVVFFQEGPGLRKWQFTLEGMKVINVTNIVGSKLDISNTNRHIDYEEYKTKYQHFSLDEEDIVIASSGNSWGKSAIVKKEHLPLLLNTSVIRFKSQNTQELDRDFLWHYINSFLFLKQIEFLITGSAQPNFGPYHLERTKIVLPSLMEQQKIAQILSTVDEQIEIYEQEKAKYEELKKGLMQQLLTGQIRVKI